MSLQQQASVLGVLADRELLDTLTDSAHNAGEVASLT
jgi:hypothetical protein